MLARKIDNGKSYAIKILKKNNIEAQNRVRYIKMERLILEKLQCPFIVKLRFAFQTRERLYIVMDYVPGGELQRYLKEQGKFQEDVARFYAAEIVLGLQSLHEADVIYRGVKPQNLLIAKDGHLKLTDFGQAKTGVALGPHKAYTFRGNMIYTAPEIIKGSGHSRAADWWSLGIFLYEMLAGCPPFDDTNKFTMLKKMTEHEIEMSPSFSENSRNLLHALLEIDPQKRLGGGKKDAEEVKSHPFFRPINWELLENRRVKPPFEPTLKGREDSQYFNCDSYQSFNSDLVFSNQIRGSNDALQHDMYADFTFHEGEFSKADHPMFSEAKPK